MSEETHCIACGNQLIQDLEEDIGFCDRCIEEACTDYWSSVLNQNKEVLPKVDPTKVSKTIEGT